MGELKKGGVLVSGVGTDKKAAPADGLIGRSFMLNSNGARLQEISGLVDAGKVMVIIAKVLPLPEAKTTHELSQSAHVNGKIILKV
ncbi:MAG: zinc-binding dehydrogenase [Methanomicrobiales archaeon]